MPDTELPKKLTPPNRIKQKIGPGANVRDLLKPETVQKGQNTINAQKDNFIIWAKEDIALLNQVLAEAKTEPVSMDQLEKIIENAEHLRDRGGTFGYDLVSTIAKSLVNYCLTIHAPSPHCSIVVAKHIEGLTTVIRGDVQGTGGMIGIELMKGLKQLVDKYSV